MPCMGYSPDSVADTDTGRKLFCNNAGSSGTTEKSRNTEPRERI